MQDARDRWLDAQREACEAFIDRSRNEVLPGQERRWLQIDQPLADLFSVCVPAALNNRSRQFNTV
jgi:hypothetical protein